MKKIKVLLLVFGLLLITGCGDTTKEVGDVTTFKEAAANNNLIVSDNIASYSDVDYIKEAVLAGGQDLSIEMVIYDDSDSAISVQEGHIDTFANMKSTSEIVKKYKGENYYKYTMISNGYYLVTSRIDNTLVFTKTLIKNKDIVDKFLNEMGY